MEPSSTTRTSSTTCRGIRPTTFPIFASSLKTGTIAMMDKPRYMFSAPQSIAAADQLLPGTMTPEWSAILSEFTRGFKSAASSARNAGAQLPRSVMRAGALAVRAAFLAANGHEEVARAMRIIWERTPSYSAPLSL